MLNSHMDVVPVFPDKWDYPPFAAFKKENGDIVARGSQDMKCVGMQYIEAVFQLKKLGVVPKRTIYIVFVPDEEIGGIDGMNKFIHTDYFKKMNIGFALDEGLASPLNGFVLYFGERAPWWLKVKAKGEVGHGSRFIKNTVCIF
jgi:aminoacylase